MIIPTFEVDGSRAVHWKHAARAVADGVPLPEGVTHAARSDRQAATHEQCRSVPNVGDLILVTVPAAELSALVAQAIRDLAPRTASGDAAPLPSPAPLSSPQAPCGAPLPAGMGFRDPSWTRHPATAPGDNPPMSTRNVPGGTLIPMIYGKGT
jgi:hypothetical protein